MIPLGDDGYCFACGPKNPQGLKLDFYAVGDALRADFVPLKEHQGYTDIIHGGIITTILDEAMAKAAIQKGIFAVTAQITVRFKEPLKVGEMAFVEAKMDKRRGNLVEATAVVQRAFDNKTIAEASSKMIIGEAISSSGDTIV